VGSGPYDPLNTIGFGFLDRNEATLLSSTALPSISSLDFSHLDSAFASITTMSSDLTQWWSIEAVIDLRVPSITSINPPSGPVGTLVTITGSNFGSTQGSSTVTFGGTPATVSSWSDTQIKATAPSLAAGTYDVVVTTSAGSSNLVVFSVTNLLVDSRPLKDVLSNLQQALIKAISRHTERTALIYTTAAQARVNNNWLVELLRAFLAAADLVLDVISKIGELTTSFFTSEGSAVVASDTSKLEQAWKGLKDTKKVLAIASFGSGILSFYQTLDDYRLFRSITDNLSIETEKVYKRSSFPATQNFVEQVLKGKDKTIQSPIFVPERSGPRTAGNRYQTLGWVRGTDQVVDDIKRKFETLLNQIPDKLPASFNLSALVVYLEQLRSQILKSESSIVGVRFFASQDNMTSEQRAVALGLIASDLAQLNPILDAIQNRLDLQYREAWDQTIVIGINTFKLYFSQIDVRGIAYRSLRILDDAIGVLQIPNLTEQTIELLNQKIDPIDALNYLAIQATWDMESEITRLWAIADGVAGIPDQGKIKGGFVRYLLSGALFPN
jgi:IPT/TIG domain-containing protein